MGCGARSSDDVGHILVLGVSRTFVCSHTVTGGLEMSVLDDVVTRLLAGFGCESFPGVR